MSQVVLHSCEFCASDESVRRVIHLERFRGRQEENAHTIYRRTLLMLVPRCSGAVNFETADDGCVRPAVPLNERQPAFGQIARQRITGQGAGVSSASVSCPCRSRAASSRCLFRHGRARRRRVRSCAGWSRNHNSAKREVAAPTNTNDPDDHSRPSAIARTRALPIAESMRDVEQIRSGCFPHFRSHKRIEGSPYRSSAWRRHQRGDCVAPQELASAPTVGLSRIPSSLFRYRVRNDK